MTNQTLDEIMSGRGGAVSETDQQAAPEPTTPSEPKDGPARDETGRFAPKDGKRETVEEPAQPDADADEPRKGGSVPQQALHAAREKERTAREEAQREREARIRLEAQLEMMSRQAQPSQPAEQPKPKQFWADPEGFLQSALQPFQQQIAQQNERLSQTAAVSEHGAETVDAAYRAMASALDSDPRAAADYQRIMQSPHPYGELVTWHRNRQALTEIGNDPKAYRDRLRNEIMAELQQGQQQQPAPAAAPRLPGNFATARSDGPRSGPTFTGPRPLSEITKGSTA